MRESPLNLGCFDLLSDSLKPAELIRDLVQQAGSDLRAGGARLLWSSVEPPEVLKKVRDGTTVEWNLGHSNCRTVCHYVDSINRIGSHKQAIFEREPIFVRNFPGSRRSSFHAESRGGN